MAKDANAPKITISDPHNVPVTFADGLAGSGTWNGLVSLTLAVNQLTPHDTGINNDFAIVARLRLDLHTATDVRDRLNVLIAGLTKPEGKAN